MSCKILSSSLCLTCIIHRALNKKLRAEELMRISKLPPAMAKREDENKKKLDVLEDFDAAHSETPDVTKSHDIAAQTKMTMKKMKKLSSRRKPKRSKSALATSSVQSKYRNIETLKSSKTSLMDSRAVSKVDNEIFSLYTFFSHLCNSPTSPKPTKLPTNATTTINIIIIVMTPNPTSPSHQRQSIPSIGQILPPHFAFSGAAKSYKSSKSTKRS